MTMMHRHYRVAAADTFVDTPSAVPAAESVGRAELAERDLRARLAAGERPEVILIAPERSVRSEVADDGELTGPCFAWDLDAAHEALSDVWLHAPHVLGVLEVDDYRPDPFPFFGQRGAVQVTGGRLTELRVSSFLRPVADHLSARYGVPVRAYDDPDIPPPVVEPADAMVLPNVLTTASIDELWHHVVDAQDTNHTIPNRLNVGRLFVAPPEELVDVAGQLLNMAAEHFGLPEVTDWQTAIVLYDEEGDHFPEHTDIDDRIPNSFDRTVSFSVLLGQQGEHFDGGDLIVNGKHVDAPEGTLVAFTAATPHEVTPITRGERLVWIAFGEIAR